MKHKLTEQLRMDALARSLLDSAKEETSVGAIIIFMKERGVDVRAVRERLKFLLENGWVRTSGSKNSLTDDEAVISLAEKGKNALRELRATTQFNMRAPKMLVEELASLRRDESASALAVQALREWVRTAKFPGIDFRWTPTGRKPHVTGTGLAVWEMYHMWKHHAESVEKLRGNYPDLTASQINAAVAYAREYLDEMPVDEFGHKPSFAREVKV